MQGNLSQNAFIDQHNYDEKFTYDQRGNITSLNRKGMIQNPLMGSECYVPGTIDSLQYTYQPGSNKLIQVVDKAPCLDTFVLPKIIDRDGSYAANQLIIADQSLLKINADILLTTGDEVKIITDFTIPFNSSVGSLVNVVKATCPDIKYTEGFSQQSTGNYLYDTAGNITFDPNKNLTFYYNHLNLAYRIVGGETDELQMLFTADGKLLKRKYIINGIIKSKIDYINNIEYHQDTIKYIHHSDGRLIKKLNTYEYEYNVKDHLGNVRITFSDIDSDNEISTLEIKSRNDYYAFGMEMGTPYLKNEAQADKNNYLYNGKEKWTEMNLNNLNYGLNTPVNAYDPDGNLVIFVNGQGPTKPLKDYWGGFDQAVNKWFNDYNNQYYEGSIGGWASTAGIGTFSMGNNLSPSNRYDAGFDRGYEDAAGLISNLARDKDGNITETIKIITHSMGGVFGSGVQNGILKYLRENPELAKQVKISLVAHFDPFQASNITADPNIYTMDFLHKYGIINDHNGTRQRNDSDGFWWLASGKVKGADEIIEDQNESGHGIKNFFNNIRDLKQGTYKWNGSIWICQNCN